MQGKLNEAEAWWQRARAEAIAGFGPTDGHLAVVAVGLAEVLRTAGGDHFAQAEALYRESVEITRREYGNQDVRSAHALQILGQYLSDAGRHNEALKVLAAAAATKQIVLGSGHVDYAQVRLVVVTLLPSYQLQRKSPLCCEGQRPLHPVLAGNKELAGVTHRGEGAMCSCRRSLSSATRTALLALQKPRSKRTTTASPSLPPLATTAVASQTACVHASWRPF